MVALHHELALGTPLSPLSARLARYGPPLVDADGPLIVMRPRAVVAPGLLATGATMSAPRSVIAHDLDGLAWWIPAESVWHDAEADRPCRPRAVGLATGPTRNAAVLAGLSDRLGYEALCALERGDDLRPVPADLKTSSDVVAFDGRVGHDIPTVVIVAEEFVRWGAGSTWEAAYERAFFSSTNREGDDVDDELDIVTSLLDEADLTPIAVDLGSAVLASVGVHRVSVQLSPPS